ncbi:hypothetical protein C8A01DRAFT_51099 [Parachaetomium inaequale]|uniref:Uncharacterized protein n=1 Tax=Parachaetomium inaequale TaxID=2588326 RepID=A0AAN6P710_9PEZI|nr:hypothetical protein C8A01DRAFT_51099 [Parachaetomium inaequale]
MRAALFRYDPPYDFTAKYLLERLFEFMPDSLSMPVTPTLAFWTHVLASKIEATIRSEGEMIGWESDEETVGPRALAAKQSLLGAIPYLLPLDTPEASLYRLVLEHGDFGIHNTTITRQASGEPLMTSLFDWETACICPALLSDPLVAVSSVTRLPEDATLADLEAYNTWASSIMRPLATRLPYERARTFATCGFLCETGVGAIQRRFLVPWARGPRSGCKNLEGALERRGRT